MEQVPAIPRVIGTYLETCRKNLTIAADPVDFRRTIDLVGGGSLAESIERLQLLCDYWGAQVDFRYARRWTEAEIEAMKQAMSPEELAEAEAVWGFLLGKLQEKNQAVIKERQEQEERRKRFEDSRWEALVREARRRRQLEELANRLVQLATAEPVDFGRVRKLLDEMVGYGNMLEENDHVPGYREIASAYRESDYPRIFDAMFFMYAVFDFQKALEILNQLKCKDSDPQALMLRAHATVLVHENFPDSVVEALSLIEKVLEMEPGHQEAQTLKGQLNEHMK